MDFVRISHENMGRRENGQFTFHSRESRSFRTALRRLVKEEGRQALLEERRLRDGLSYHGAPWTQTVLLCRLSKVSGYCEFVRTDAAPDQTLRNRLIYNAVREAGLCYDTTTYLLDCLSSLSGIPSAFCVICDAPPRFLPEDWRKRLENITENHPSETDRSQENYLRGSALLKSVSRTERKQGLSLLRIAADRGDYRAAFAVGDACYQLGPSRWNLTWRYYTMYGAPPLNGSQKNALLALLNQRCENWKILLRDTRLFALLLGALLLISLLAEIFFHISPDWNTAVPIAALFGLSLVRHILNPFRKRYCLNLSGTRCSLISIAMAAVWVGIPLLRLAGV